MARPFLLFVLLWTLALLLLGSIVHATGSSLACPDWPTCFGTMMPEMTGGVFWEHLHRLWAGGLLVFFPVAVVSVRRTYPARQGLYRLGLAGIALLVLQSVLGGLTVIYRLPDAVSTSHLALAFIFLGLVTVMLVQTGPRGDEPIAGAGAERRAVWKAGCWITGLVFVQSLVGALVRHTDAGMACPDVPLCLGRVIPPLQYPAVQLHFAHRVLGVVVAVAVVLSARTVLAHTRDAFLRRLAAAAAVGVVGQVLLGFASVAFQLGVPWVSAHTLLAAILFSAGVATAARSQP